MTFRDISEVFDPAIYLPIKGKTYRVSAPDAAAGLRLQLLMKLGAAAESGHTLPQSDLDKLVLEDSDEEQFFRDNLGTAYEQMKADAVELEYIKHAAQTAFMRWTVDADLAEAYWNGAGVDVGKAPAPGLRPTVTRTGAAAASTTKPPASRTGTKTARKANGKRKGRR